MIATVAFVLFFLSLGLGVVFIALGNGPRGARGRLHGRTRSGRKVSTLVIAVISLAFGIGVPAVVIAANTGSQSKRATGGVQLTAFQEHGRRVWAKNCATCHTLRAANSVGRVGPSLDTLRPPKALVLNAIALGRARGMGQMPRGLVDGQDAAAVADFVASTAGR